MIAVLLPCTLSLKFVTYNTFICAIPYGHLPGNLYLRYLRFNILIIFNDLVCHITKIVGLILPKAKSYEFSLSLLKYNTYVHCLSEN